MSIKLTNCVNCGAVLRYNKCEYCDTVYPPTEVAACLNNECSYAHTDTKPNLSVSINTEDFAKAVSRLSSCGMMSMSEAADVLQQTGLTFTLLNRRRL